MEKDLHLGESLNIARLDVMNAADVQEMVLVMKGEQAFHLRRIHTPIGLDHVNDRLIQVREDIDLHTAER